MKAISPSSSRLFLIACLLVSGAAMVLLPGPWQQQVHSGSDNLPVSQASPTPYPCQSVASCPNAPVTNITSPQVPCDVCIPSSFPSAANAIAFFDDYSWRSFIALVWPALQNQRGVPDTNQTVDGKGPRVFETYKGLWELFHFDGSAPSGWNDYDPPTMNACGATTAFGDLVLASFSKFSDLGQAGFGKLVGPLVAQNQTYVSYLTAYNQIEFDQITSNNWYLRAKLPSTITFNPQSVDIKSAWMDMTNAKHPERYYTRMATVMDPVSGKCSPKLMGLVGLHIVQKTPTRPQWIWSTFEQVDNVPPAQPGAPGTFGFNDGTSTPMPPKNPYSVNPLPTPVPPPFNVTRTKPISTLVVQGLPSTVQTNANYQQALKKAGSVWQYYQLVMTQWPVPGNTPANPGTPAFSFPGTGATTSFANTTMETFDQSSIATGGCMSCHTVTKTGTDFLWSLADHAFPPKIPSLLMQDPAFRELKTLIEKSQPMEKPSAKPVSKRPVRRR